MDAAEIEAATRVLAARSPFRYYGPDVQREVSQFERELAQFIGVPFCLGVASGTSALNASLAALGVGPGDEVIIPGYFWVSTVAAVVHNGAIPVLGDVDEHLALDPTDLERKITARTRAVIMVHMGGVVGQVERVADICRSRSVLLLEDCAQALGAAKSNTSVGQFGDIAIFSFQMNKICTAGEGGAIVTRNEAIFGKVTAIHDLGYPRDISGSLVMKDDEHQSWGIGCRMNEITAAVLRVQLRKLPAIVSEMRSLYERLAEIVRSSGRVVCLAGDDARGSAGTCLSIRFDSERSAKTFQKILFTQSMRGCRQAFRTTLLKDYGLHLYHNVRSLVSKRSICGHHSVWEMADNAFARHYSYDKGALPALDALEDRVLLFPIPVGLTLADQEDLLRVFDLACVSRSESSGAVTVGARP